MIKTARLQQTLRTHQPKFGRHTTTDFTLKQRELIKSAWRGNLDAILRLENETSRSIKHHLDNIMILIIKDFETAIQKGENLAQHLFIELAKTKMTPLIEQQLNRIAHTHFPKHLDAVPQLILNLAKQQVAWAINYLREPECFSHQPLFCEFVLESAEQNIAWAQKAIIRLILLDANFLLKKQARLSWLTKYYQNKRHQNKLFNQAILTPRQRNAIILLKIFAKDKEQLWAKDFKTHLFTRLIEKLSNTHEIKHTYVRSIFFKDIDGLIALFTQQEKIAIYQRLQELANADTLWAKEYLDTTRFWFNLSKLAMQGERWAFDKLLSAENIHPSVMEMTVKLTSHSKCPKTIIEHFKKRDFKY